MIELITKTINTNKQYSIITKKFHMQFYKRKKKGNKKKKKKEKTVSISTIKKKKFHFKEMKNYTKSKKGRKNFFETVVTRQKSVK